MTTKLTSRWVLGFDGSDHVLFEDAEVVFDGARIISVGPRSTLPADVQHDLGATLLAPGFIDLNALADSDTTILGFGSAGAAGRGAWSRAYAQRSHDVLNADDMVASARGTFAQLLLSGVTTALPVTSLLFRAWGENAAEFARIAALSDELGIRLVLGPSFRSSVNVIEPDGLMGQLVDVERGMNGLADAIGFIDQLAGTIDGLVSGLLVPSTIDTCSDALLVATAAAARDANVPFRLHCCQSLFEAELIWQRSGKTSIGLLHDLGVLSERALLPHAIHLGGPHADPAMIAADRKMLADSGATVVHCPLVVGRGGRRLEGFGSMRDEGIRIAMGTDTAPPNMLMNLQTGLSMARIDKANPVGPADYIRAATLNGAASLARTDLGRLAPGAAADIVAWDLSGLDVQPVHDPIEALLLMPPGLRARQVWVGGRHVVADGKVVGFDEAASARAIQSNFEKLRQSYGERHWQQAQWPALFPPSFPSGTTTHQSANQGNDR